MGQNYNNKRITGKEKLAKYRKTILNRQKWTNELPQDEGPLNRDGNPKHPPGQRIVTHWPVLDLKDDYATTLRLERRKMDW